VYIGFDIPALLCTWFRNSCTFIYRVMTPERMPHYRS